MPQLMDLLKHSLFLENKKVDPKAAAPAPIKPGLFDIDDDPFNGNLNNRRVAQRIADGDKNQVPSTANGPVVGNPVKAAADVAKSQVVTPEPPKEDESAPHSFGPPAGWKPNA
jgi:hypothetical protein